MVSYSCAPTMEPRLLVAARAVRECRSAWNQPSGRRPPSRRRYAAPVRAVVYDALGVEPRVVDVPDPACPDDGVVLDVAATGVCRSDWHAWRGHEVVALPHTPGHELRRDGP